MLGLYDGMVHAQVLHAHHTWAGGILDTHKGILHTVLHTFSWT